MWIILEYSDALHLPMFLIRKGRNDKVEKCVFIAISEAFKGYKLFNPCIKKIVTNRDVVFYEGSTWNRNGHQPTQVLLDEKDENKQTSTSYTSKSSPRITSTVTETSPTNNDEEEVQSPPRVKKRLAWIEDYEVTGILDPITHFSLFSYCDPSTFESVVK